MGRHLKEILTEDGLDRREKGYYATPRFVADFIAREMIAINPDGKSVLDPAVGKEELIDAFYDARKEIDGIDIEDYGIHAKANFIQQDFIEYYRQQINGTIFRDPTLKYDYYVANPPYNCHEVNYIRENKRVLNSLYGEVGSSNMYSMFIYSLVEVAKEGALIGLITYDSFLTARIYAPLRRKILAECSIHRLILCPTDLFLDQDADVRTCIIVLQKGRRFQGSILTLNRMASKDQFILALETRAFSTQNLGKSVLSDSSDNDEFVIGVPDELIDLFRYPRIGDLYKCITGISTGNDAKYISKTKDADFAIPFYKNPGTRRFYSPPDGYLPRDFLEISKRVPNFIVRNHGILLSEGISCSSMGVTFSACYLPSETTFGVNAKIVCDASDIWWLLSYLNSSIVTYFVRSVLIRSNMITSGYVSRIPVVPLPAAVKEQLGSLSREAWELKVENGQAVTYVRRIDELIFRTLCLGPRVVEEIQAFCKDLVRRT